MNFVCGQMFVNSFHEQVFVNRCYSTTVGGRPKATSTMGDGEAANMAKTVLFCSAGIESHRIARLPTPRRKIGEIKSLGLKIELAISDSRFSTLPFYQVANSRWQSPEPLPANLLTHDTCTVHAPIATRAVFVHVAGCLG